MGEGRWREGGGGDFLEVGCGDAGLKSRGMWGYLGPAFNLLPAGERVMGCEYVAWFGQKGLQRSQG